MVYCLFVWSAAFSSPPRNHATGLIGPSSLKKSVGREGIEPPQPKAADLQIDARERPAAAENSRISEQTLKPTRKKVRGVRRPRKSGSGGTTLPDLSRLRPRPLPFARRKKSS